MISILGEMVCVGSKDASLVVYFPCLFCDLCKFIVLNDNYVCDGSAYIAVILPAAAAVVRHTGFVAKVHSGMLGNHRFIFSGCDLLNTYV